MTETGSFSAEEELEYWRALAFQRGAELETLRRRSLDLAEMHPDVPVAAFLASAGGAGWLREVDRIGRSPQLQQTNVVDVLDDLWSRVERDHPQPAER